MPRTKRDDPKDDGENPPRRGPLSMSYIVRELKRIRRLPKKEDRTEALKVINGRLWKPTYEEVKESLRINSLRISISSWVLDGVNAYSSIEVNKDDECEI